MSWPKQDPREASKLLGPGYGVELDGGLAPLRLSPAAAPGYLRGQHISKTSKQPHRWLSGTTALATRTGQGSERTAVASKTSFSLIA
jgi:hypothetical protein